MRDLTGVIQSVRASRAWDFTTKAGLCAYSRAVIEALHAADPEWGYLSKTEGQNHCDLAPGVFVAVDAALYKSTGQIVDFIQSAGYGTPAPSNNVAWGLGPEGEYGATHWIEPGAGTPPGPGPDPAPAPPPAVDLTARLAALERRVEQHRVRMEAINARFASESELLNVHRPLPEYVGTVWGFKVTSRPKE